MEHTKFEIRVLLKHYWKQDYKAAAAARRIREVVGEGVVSERGAHQWFQRFNTGQENTKYLPHSGSTAVGQAVACAPVTQQARVRSPVGTNFLGEDFSEVFLTCKRNVRKL